MGGPPDRSKGPPRDPGGRVSESEVARRTLVASRSALEGAGKASRVSRGLFGGTEKEKE